MPATARRQIPYPAGADNVDVPGDLEALAEALDNHAIDLQGTLGARPDPGDVDEGTYYMAIDTGELARSNGVDEWVPIGNPNALLKSLADAKGDILAATGADAWARVVASGIAGNVLVEDPAEPTGWKSAAAPSGGVGKGNAFPAGPTDGDLFVRTDQAGDPLYKYTDGVWQKIVGKSVYARVERTAAAKQTINVAATTIMQWNAELADTDGMWDAGAPDRLTVQTAGVYVLLFQFRGPSGERDFRLNIFHDTAGGAGIDSWEQQVDPYTAEAFDAGHSVIGIANANVGDTFKASVRHNSGATRDVWGRFYAIKIDSAGDSLEAWHQVGGAGEPAFQNAWVNNSEANWGPVRFRKDRGKVTLVGAASGGGANASIFTLPIGYRPPQRRRFIVDHNGGPGRLEVGADGTVFTIGGASATTFLDGVSFYVD